jgi:hypothetical protein
VSTNVKVATTATAKKVKKTQGTHRSSRTGQSCVDHESRNASVLWRKPRRSRHMHTIFNQGIVDCRIFFTMLN